MLDNRRLPLVSAVLLLWFLASSAEAQKGSQTPRSFVQVGEIVDHWSASQHLWIKGKLGVSSAHLAQLKAWLHDKAPNWTIVLLENAREQRFKNYRGMDAVEHALGKQLANRTDFGTLTDKRTGESNGAFFILFLKERKFSYYASEAFDRRNLGENRWVGRLDKPAIRAMRSGGRIIDAVKDTVTTIESKLSQSIESEVATRRRAAIARDRAIEEAKQLSKVIGEEIDRMTNEVGEIRKRQPKANGNLVELPIASWRGSQKAINDYAAAEEISNAQKLADQVRIEIAGFRAGLTRWAKDVEEIERLRQRLQAVPTPGDDLPAIEGYLSQAQSAYEAAKENHSMAESLYLDQIEVCNQAIDRANTEFAAWQAATLAEQQRLAARRKAIGIASGLIALLCLLGLLLLNRQRAPAKEEAEATLNQWKRQLKGKFDQLFALMDRATVIVGPSSKLKNRGFEGNTLSLCQKSIHGVDELFIMSSATDIVIDRATALVHPRSPWGGLVNAFSGRRYREATGLLSSQPVGFDRDQGLEAVLEPTGKPQSNAVDRSLLGDPEDYEPFRMSFEELIVAYDEKQAAAIAAVDRLEHCVDGLPLLLEALDRSLGDVTQASTDLAEAAADDGFFPMENLRRLLLPAASANLEKAIDRGRADPVTAMENSATETERQLNSALRLSSRLEAMRKEDFVSVAKAAGELESSGRRVAWIDRHYAELSNVSEQLSELMVDRSVDAELSEFEDDLLQVRGRVAHCAKLARSAEREVPSAIRKAEAEAKVARKALARRLKLSPSQVLTEERLSPFKKVEEAEKELEAARIALDRGNMEAAQEDFAEIESSLDEVRDLIQLSEEVAHSHGERHQALEELLSDTRSQEPTVAPLLEEMITHYHPDVLRFSIRSGKAEAGQESIRESCNQASERLTSAQDALISSETAFSKGRLIEAGGLLERAGNEIGFARHQLSLIEDQHAALKETEDQNAKALIELRRRQQHLDSSIADGRTMMPTITQYRELAVALDHAEAEIGKVRPNPFAAQRLLTQQEEDLNAIEQGVESDWILHANAVTAVETARAHLAQSDRVVNRAQTDQISDSIPLEKGMQCHAELAAHLAEVETVLQTDHADWPSIQEAMNATIQETINNRNLMEAELKAAQSAINELHKASQSLSELQGWRSRHHVKVDREAGWRSLRKAREALDRGDYAEANKDAQKAHRKATWALTEARRDERRAEAEAARRRREAARRRRERESFSFNSFSSGSSGSSGFGSSRSSGFGSSRSSSFGSSSGSSGFSSGSFSSGSGVSRSGW